MQISWNACKALLKALARASAHAYTEFLLKQKRFFPPPFPNIAPQQLLAHVSIAHERVDMCRTTQTVKKKMGFSLAVGPSPVVAPPANLNIPPAV